MKIEVTQEDIDNGKRQDPNSCPVALAVRKEIKEGDRLFAGYGSIIIYGLRKFLFFHKTIKADVPYSAFDFMVRYDSNLPVEPFSFDVTFREI